LLRDPLWDGLLSAVFFLRLCLKNPYCWQKKKEEEVVEEEVVEEHVEEHVQVQVVKEIPVKELYLKRYKLPDVVTYVKKDLKPMCEPTEFDNVLFGDLKLRQVPKFLWQHRTGTSAGWTRGLNYLERRLGGLDHPHQGLKSLQWLGLFGFLWYLQVFVYEKFKWQEKMDTVISRRFGLKNFENMHPIERRYYYVAIARQLPENE